MDMWELLLLILIAIAAAYYGIHSGRAKADRLRNIPSTISTMRIRDWIIVAFIICGVVVVSSMHIQRERDAQKDSLREQFRVPPDIEFLDFQQGGNGKKIQFNATVGFTPQQWQDYITDLDDPSLWRPVPIRRSAPIPLPFKEDGILFKGGVIDGDYAANTRVWNDLPKPLKADSEKSMHIHDIPMLYYIWWDEGEAQPKTGKIMCYMFQRSPTVKGADTPWHLEANYKVSACADLTKRESYYIYVLGILDFDAKTLRMAIR